MNERQPQPPGSRIGVIGLGAMGGGMATKLVEEGFDLTVYNRTRSKSEVLGHLGAKIASSPGELGANVDVVLLSLPDQHTVAAQLWGDGGLVQGLRPDSVLVNTSTVSPDFARTLATQVASAGSTSIDACVLGNSQHARNGELRFMVGGSPDAFRRLRPVLDVLGKEVTYLGADGLGATMKLVLNMLMGIEMQALAEAIVLGERAGLSRDMVLRMLSNSGFTSPVMRFKCDVMKRRAFETPDFRLALMRKDMALAMTEAQRLSIPLATATAAATTFTAASQQGLGHFDCASILALMERLSGLETYPWPGAATVSA